ncbi:hypothetical protein WJX72_008242 [[Myrmecia] bisecta]|uniref:Dymeclin n=1 Tax=[Myrmecia] bisecta TaxID=41462 RepID=A0AAW1Q804_9CHLO
MGTASSNLVPGHDELLSRFAGSSSVATTDPFWAELLTCPSALTKLPPQDVEAATVGYCRQLVDHNKATQHFQKLLWHTLERLRGAHGAARLGQATNAVYFVHVLVKYLADELNSAQLAAFIGQPLTDPASKRPLEDAPPLVTEAVQTLLDVLGQPVAGPASYLLHLEVMNLLLVMTSTQLYTPAATAQPGAHPFTDILMEQESRAPRVLQALLQHYIARQPLPPRAPLWVPSAAAQQGVLRFVRTAAVSVLLLPVRAYTFLIRSSQPQQGESVLAETALLLLLVLVHHAPPQDSKHHNPFRRSLRRIQDADDVGDEDAAESGRANTPGEPSVSYSGLYDALGKGLVHERSVLLLYSLLHDCVNFQNYVLVRSDLETMLLPLLQMLYTASSRTPSQMYMLLIIILILSQDIAFSQNIHKIIVPAVPWYKERMLVKTSLGSLLVILLLRTAHYNLSKLKDVYLHTNTLAALANLAPHAAGLSAHAAQRLVSLFNMLARRYQRLNNQANGSIVNAADHASNEVQVYADFLRIVLEIINCIITTGLAHNPELVYALLHRQEVFEPFRTHPRFAELLENVKVMLDFFNAKVEEARLAKGWDWNVEKVLAVIKGNLRHWRPDKLRQFQELRFTYEEETSPEDFFVPYIWSLVVGNTTIPWNGHAIALFSPVGALEEGLSLDTYSDASQVGRHDSADSEITDIV